MDHTMEEKMMVLQEKKERLINGAFHIPAAEERRQRIRNILYIFNLAGAPTL